MKIYQLAPLALLTAIVSSSSAQTVGTSTESVPHPLIVLGGPKFEGWTGLNRPKNGAAMLSLPGEAAFRFTDTPPSQRDWYRARGVHFEVQLPDNTPTRLDVRLLSRKKPLASTLLVGRGWHSVSLAWNNFDFTQDFPMFLSGVEGLSITGSREDSSKGQVALRNVQVVRGDKVWLGCDTRGKSAKPGGSVEYQVQVGNPTQQVQGVTLHFEKSGYNAMTPTVSPSSLVLKPGETRVVTVRVQVPERIPAGGHETQTLRATGNGQSATSDKVDFITAAALDYPNILHTKTGWDAIRDKVKRYDWAKAAMDDNIKRSSDWNVPTVANQNNPKRGDWLFRTQEEGNVFASGIAYQGTFEKKHAEKVKLFLLRLSDPQNGYPITRRGCHQASVQEGHFFQNLVFAYDMTIPSGVYSTAEREQIDATLRLFIEPEVNSGIGIGDQVSNWNISYLCGQLYASLVLQDLVATKRFLYAPHGLIHQLVYGTLDDGWWFEVSVSYNTWVASEFSQAAIAMQPWGYDLANTRFPANYRSNVEKAPQDEEYGMSKAQWGPIHHNWMSIKRMWDVLPRMVDYRGVMFGLNDSTENRIGGEGMELAYYLYRDPAYVSVIKMGEGRRSLLYGVPELPEGTPDLSAQSTYSDNAGVAVLRSKAAGKDARERIQSVLRYGDHGFFHGHFDRADLVHLSRYGRSFFNPEFIWYSYPNFMYKFYVQTSVSKNMVVVDQKMQEPQPSQRLLFHSGPMLQASAIQTNSRWSNPPYGGMFYWDQPHKTFEEKSFAEGRSVPVPPDAPEYGKVTDYTEPVLQRRLMLVTDDYVVLADYLKGDKEHTFDSLFQMKGFAGLEGAEKTLLRHDGQWSSNPLSSAQFVTDADWYSVAAPARSQWQFRGKWSNNNTDGDLNIDLHTLWPPRQEIMIATPPEMLGGNRQVSYAIRGDGKTLKEGKTGTWILGQVNFDVPLNNAKTLELETNTGNTTPGTLFWGGVKVVTQDGREIPLAQLPFTSENAQQPKTKGLDFQDGPIKIAGVPYPEAVSGQPQDGKKPTIVKVDLSGVNAVRLVGVMGGDFPLGDESERRKTVAVRSVGKSARFLTVIEPFENKRMVKSAVASDADSLRVTLEDGRVQDIRISGLEGDGSNIVATLTETKDGRISSTETAQGNP